MCFPVTHLNPQQATAYNAQQQANGVQQAIEDQTRVLKRMQQEQVNDNLRNARQADEAR